MAFPKATLFGKVIEPAHHSVIYANVALIVPLDTVIERLDTPAMFEVIVTEQDPAIVPLVEQLLLTI